MPVKSRTPDSLARVATLTLAEGPLGEARFNIYMKGFVDEMSRPTNQHAPIIQRMIAEEPVELPYPLFNTFLAGAAEFIAQRHDIAVPEWALSESRFLPRPIIFGIRAETRALMQEETPGPFRRRNLFCGEVWLHSRRWDAEDL